MGMTALCLGLYFLAELHLDDFPLGINPYWDYFWLNWRIMLIAGCCLAAYGLLRPKQWGWFFAQLMIVIFYFGYVYLKMVVLGLEGLGGFYLLHFPVIAVVIAFFQHPEIHHRFVDSEVKLRRPRRILKNVTGFILLVGLVPMLVSSIVAQNFPKLEETTVQGGRTARGATAFHLPTGYRITLPAGTRMVDTFRVFIDSEALQVSRENMLKQGFLNYSFSTRALVLLTPDGTQVYLQDGTFVQKLMDSLSLASYFHRFGYNRSDYELGLKWYRERVGLLFVVERGMEMDFQFGKREGYTSRLIRHNGLKLITETYQVKGRAPAARKVQLFHVYREGQAAGGGLFAGTEDASFKDLIASIEQVSTVHPSAEEYFERGVEALETGNTEEAGMALGSALFLFDGDPRYHYMFAQYLLTWPGGISDALFDRVVRHLQEALDLDPDFQPALDLARQLGLGVQVEEAPPAQ